jgi:mono/diheme cytochrome c family protein
MSGRWRVEPLVRRSGRDDARVALTVPIAEPLGSNVDQGEGFELTPRMILGVEAGIFGLILIVAARQLRRRSTRASWSALVGGFAAIAIGGYVTATAVSAEQATPGRLKNPVTMDQPALARGRMLYQQNCLTCHGVAGRGDGPVGRSLNPRPADLRAHVTQHPDGQLFDWVSNGVPGSAMPAFKDAIPAEDRWRLIGFIKGFAEDGPAPAQTAAADLRRTAPGGPGASGTPTAPERALAQPAAAAPGTTAAAARVGDQTVTARIAPDRYRRGAANTISVETAPARPGPLRYRLAMVGHEMAPDQGEARPLGDGRYELPAAPRFDMAGDWRLDLDVDDRTATYWLTVDREGTIAFQEP